MQRGIVKILIAAIVGLLVTLIGVDDLARAARAASPDWVIFARDGASTTFAVDRASVQLVSTPSGKMGRIANLRTHIVGPDGKSHWPDLLYQYKTDCQRMFWANSPGLPTVWDRLSPDTIGEPAEVTQFLSIVCGKASQ